MRGMVRVQVEQRLAYNGGGRTEGWVEKNEDFGLKMSSIGGHTRSGVSTGEKKSQLWSSLVLKFLNHGPPIRLKL